MATACLSDIMGWDVIHDCESSSKYILKVPFYGHWTTFTLCIIVAPTVFTIVNNMVHLCSCRYCWWRKSHWPHWFNCYLRTCVCPQQASLLTWDQGANKVIASGLQRCFLSLSSFHGRNSWKGSDSCVSSREESPLFVMTTGTLIRQCTQEKQTVLVVLSWEGLLIVRGQDTTVSFYQSRPQKSKFTFCLFTSLFLVFRHK